MTIMRLWHGEVAIDKADDYEQFMIERAAPNYSSVEGLLNLYFQRKDETDKAHFLLVTIWDSLESMKNFSGADSEVAKYYPEGDAFLLDKEKHSAVHNIFFQKSFDKAN